MAGDTIIDLEKYLRERSVGGTPLEEFAARVGEHYRQSFLTLAEQRGLSEAWATDKAELATEVVTSMLQLADYSFQLKVPEALSEAQQHAIAEQVEQAVKGYRGELVLRCLRAFTTKALLFALPEPR